MYAVEEARGLVGECEVPGDPDTALYLLGAAAMLPRSDLTLYGICDAWKTRRALDLLRRINAQLDIRVTRSKSKPTVRTVHVKGSELRRTRLAGEQTALFLQEIPFLAALGTQAAGETVIRDAEQLRHGEIDRLSLLIQNLRQMGARVGEMPDGLVVQGPARLQGAEVNAGDDARMALALALAGLAAEGETRVLNPGTLCRDFAELFARLSTLVKKR